jgi:hypothetical protein
MSRGVSVAVLELAWLHVLQHNVIGDKLTPRLVLCNNLLQNLNQQLLQLSRQHRTA